MTTLVVTTSADVTNGDVSGNDLSLREAIELANARDGADRITFADGIHYVALKNKLPTISDNLRLVGGGDVTLDANVDGDRDPSSLQAYGGGHRRGLTIDGDGIDVSIDGLTITGGAHDRGAGVWSSSRVSLSIVDSHIAWNTTAGTYDYYSGDIGGGPGGGIFSGGDLTVRRSYVEHNYARDFGGGVVVNGVADFARTEISSNSAGGVSARGDISLRHSIVADNGDQFYHNYSRPPSGGGVYSAGNVTLLNCRVVGNSVESLLLAGGGGVRAVGAVDARDSYVAGNRVVSNDLGFGGGIYAGSIRLQNCTIRDNYVDAFGSGLGGGIASRDIKVYESSIVLNDAGSDGFSASSSSSVQGGGGIWLGSMTGDPAILILENSTIAWNSAWVFEASESGAGGGGILANDERARIVANGITVTGNRFDDYGEQGGSGGGGILASDAQLILMNSLVVGNLATHGEHEIVGSPTLHSSLIAGDGREIFADTFRLARGIFGGELAENGGLTLTAALLARGGNPALGGADPVSATPTDQRGVARDPHPDIGAFEATRRPGVTLVGTAERDVLKGSAARDTLDGRGGDDRLWGLGAPDELRGGAGDDRVRGQGGDDVVDGGGGSDRIFGGRGDDLLTGGAGRDGFVFFERFGTETITDFDARPGGGQELIDLRHLDIAAGSFAERVRISDIGSETRIVIEDAGTIVCRGVTGEGSNAIGLEDFLLE